MLPSGRSSSTPWQVRAMAPARRKRAETPSRSPAERNRPWYFSISISRTSPGTKHAAACASRTALPIVLMSGMKTDDLDRVAGLLLGADDYLVKPIAAGELLARIRRVVLGSGASLSKLEVHSRAQAVAIAHRSADYQPVS